MLILSWSQLRTPHHASFPLIFLSPLSIDLFPPQYPSPFKSPLLPSNPSLQVQVDRPATRRPMPLMLTVSKIVNATPCALPVRHLTVGAVGLKCIFVMDQNCYKTKFIFFHMPSCYRFHLRPATFISDLHFSSSASYLTCARCCASSTLPFTGSLNLFPL